MANTANRVWFITGTSRGFGREWAIAALERGDQVAATAREPKRLDDLVRRFGDAILPLALDVTDRTAATAAVERAHGHFGRLDVIINNAGYGLFGMVEEITEAEARAQLDTNFFGAMWVTQAALPFLRAQKRGHLIQVSSIGGISAFPGLALYHASKWALEGFSQALAGELRPFGVFVTLVEPGGYATDWNGASAAHTAPLAPYDALREKMKEWRRTRRVPPGDPLATRGAILKIVDAAEPPLRVFFGAEPLAMAKADYASRIAEWEKWEAVSREAQGPGPETRNVNRQARQDAKTE